MGVEETYCKNVADKNRRARFQREVAVTQSLNHPNILRVVDHDLNAERPYFVAEYCKNLALESFARDQYRGNIQNSLSILIPIIDALVEAHRVKVVHRDVKPANILIREDGSPVIADFGICSAEDGESLTESDEGVVSRNFIAPEMESGQHDLGEPSDRTDVYNLGKVIYWMLSGGRTFARERHRSSSLVNSNRLSLPLPPPETNPGHALSRGVPLRVKIQL